MLNRARVTFRSSLVVLAVLSCTVLGAQVAIPGGDLGGGIEPIPVPEPQPTGPCARTIVAEVVALDQVLVWNRFGSHDPAGMIYALKRDVVPMGTPVGAAPPDGGWNLQPGDVQLRGDLRPRPITLRANEGDCLKVVFTNLLSQPEDRPHGCEDPIDDDGDGLFDEDPENGLDDDGDGLIDEDPPSTNSPRTRHASFHVAGLSFADASAAASNVGYNGNNLAAPGETRTYNYLAEYEGTYLASSMGATAGGEGDGGTLVHGLFGAVNVEPNGSRWKHSSFGTNLIQGNRKEPGVYQTVSAPLDAIIYGHSEPNDGVEFTTEGNFREFTVIFHDELETCHPNELIETEFWLHSVRDAFGVNYGCSGLGQMLLDARCYPDCRYEDFFLTSWANGDPALLQQYVDDPSNVHHSYLGDPVKFRNLHAGPKETHVFHLHAHQWVYTPKDDNSTYLDSQTIGPGGAFTYEIAYGGSGNRNLTPGDSIFHCHLYPHFAQGMWELWRVHDVFETGERTLPDCTPIPRVAPIPGRALPPLPTADLPGYPFFIPGVFGHRPPQPALDFDTVTVTDDDGTVHIVEKNGGLPRHIVVGGSAIETPLGTGPHNNDSRFDDLTNWIQLASNAPLPVDEFDNDGDGCFGEDPLNGFDDDFDGLVDEDPYDLTHPDGGQVAVIFLPRDGTFHEQRAMEFHATHPEGKLFSSTMEVPGTWVIPDGPIEPTCEPYVYPESLWGGIQSVVWNKPAVDPTDADYPAPSVYTGSAESIFAVNGLPPVPGAPFANPCPPWAPDRDYYVSAVQLDFTINDAGWHDPQGRINVLDGDVAAICAGLKEPEPFFFRANSGDCIQYRHTNRIPRELCLDDFQVRTPTDTIGQHIHLVKFDVTASDGSGNGWNYEDGTFSPEEVEDRLAAIAGTPIPLGDCHIEHLCDDVAGDGMNAAMLELAYTLEPRFFAVEPLVQTTRQVWWADPLLNGDGEDHTIRTVFTHDHFGPSSIQQHGFYGALVIEPCGSEWQDSITGDALGNRWDGGPTATQAMIIPPATEEAFREFCLAIADFAIVYDECGNPVNPPKAEEEDPCEEEPDIPMPEAVSAADPGTMVVNYKQEPIPLRVGRSSSGGCSTSTDELRPGIRGKMRTVFSSIVHGDPATPLLKAYDGDRVQIRLIQGAQEEQHVFSINALKWKRQIASPDSEYVNAQPIGISEHFEFEFVLPTLAKVIGSAFGAGEIAMALGDDSVDGTQLTEADFIGKTGYLRSRGIADYLYGSISEDDFWNGMWGILRSFRSPNQLDPATGDPVVLAELPSNPFANDAPDDPGNLGDFTVFDEDLSAADFQRVDIQSVSAVALPEMDATAIEIDGAIPAPSKGRFLGFCPPGSPIRKYIIHAYTAQDILPSGTLTYNSNYGIHDPSALMYVLDEDLVTTPTGVTYVGNEEPLVIRALPGECIVVSLHNHLPDNVPDHLGDAFHAPIVELQPDDFRPDNWVGLHPQLVGYPVQFQDGTMVGYNRNQLVRPGKSRRYAWYAGHVDIDPLSGNLVGTPAELGVINLRSFGDIVKQGPQGLVGALVVEPEGSQWFAPGTNTPIVHGAMADIEFTDGSEGFTEMVMVYQDGLNLLAEQCQPACPPEEIGPIVTEFPATELDPVAGIPVQPGEPICSHVIPHVGDDAEDSGEKAYNYRTEPFWARLNGGVFLPPDDMNDIDLQFVYDSNVYGDPVTPLPMVEAGRRLMFRVCQPTGRARQHAFALHGHNWLNEPMNPKSLVLGAQDAMTVGQTLNLWMLSPAGGPEGVAVDYLYEDFPSFQHSQGMWGILRVLPGATDPDGPIATGEQQPTTP